MSRFSRNEKARKEAAENHKELTARLADQEAKNSQLREDLGFVQEGKTADLIQELREHVKQARIDALEEARAAAGIRTPKANRGELGIKP